MSDTNSLRSTTLHLEYIEDVSSVVRAMHSVKEEFQAVELLWEAARGMGAEAAIFASFVREGDAGQSVRLLLACEPVRVEEAREARGHRFEAWLDYARKHSEPIRDSEAPSAGAAASAAVSLAHQLGFKSTVIVPVPSCGTSSRTGVLCLGSSSPGYFDDEGYVTLKIVARGVAMELHEWWVRRLRDELVAASGLTAADLDLLSQEQLGHTSKSIARRLGVSICAVNSRFQRINAKLGTGSRKAAANLAAEYGLI
jgi:DNA-binding CsgD family transcriptional regulator